MSAARALCQPPEGFEFVMEVIEPLCIEAAPAAGDFERNVVTFRAIETVRIRLRAIPSVPPITLTDHDGGGVRGDG